ncbi:MAG: CarD family transcriptional regulator, partial [Patescibacteria group bacterium]
MEKKQSQNEILVAAVTPQFLERGILWFQENGQNIKKALQEQKEPWKSSVILLENGQALRPSSLLRHLSELGYEKTQTIISKGEFSQRGNIIEVSPINFDEKITIEFYGNTIDEIIRSPISNNTLKKIRREREFIPGDYVVHLDHGVGIFKNITTLEGRAEKFFEIEYAPPRNGAPHDTLYIPFSQKKKIDLYIGFETPTIHRLGGSVWINTRSKAREDIEAFAKELLEIYGKRAVVKRRPLHSDAELEEKFSHSFPYQETPDQKKA